MKSIQQSEQGLSAGSREKRLQALASLLELERSGQKGPGDSGGADKPINCHIHTVYSFSPYTPAGAVWAAHRAGLAVAGIVDHDSVAGIPEFRAAGTLAALPVTCGLELRVSFTGTPFEGRRLNSPDQVSIGYAVLHGIPQPSLGLCEEFLAPLRARRLLRSRAMARKLSSFIAPFGLELDFDRDIAPLSHMAEGGALTERHILFALAQKLMRVAGGPGPAAAVLAERLTGSALPGSRRALLENPQNPFYAYDLAASLKPALTPRFYLDAGGECPSVDEFIGFAQRCGGVAAYAYLGDGHGCRFEDGFLEDLFSFLREAGFHAVAYMPSRNTASQIGRVALLCRRYGLWEISGEDINSPGQPFAGTGPPGQWDKRLKTAAWALVGHENAAAHDVADGMFGRETISRLPSLEERAAFFAARGRALSRGRAYPSAKSHISSDSML